MDKTIRISREAYAKIKQLSKSEQRTMRTIVDIRFGVTNTEKKGK